MTTRTLATMVADGMTASESRGRAFRVTGGDYRVGATVEVLNGATGDDREICTTVTEPGMSGARVGEHVDVRPEYLSPVEDEAASVTFSTLVEREDSEALRARRFVILPNAQSRFSGPEEIAPYVGATVESLYGRTDTDGDVYCRVTATGSSSTSVGRTLYVKPEYLATEENGTETRDVETLARQLAEVTRERDTLRTMEAASREALASRIRAHEADIALIGEALLEEAEERQWCEVFDGVVDTLNARLTVELPTRGPTEVTLYITDENGDNLYSVVVESSDAYDAAGDLVRYASRNGLISDYSSE